MQEPEMGSESQQALGEMVDESLGNPSAVSDDGSKDNYSDDLPEYAKKKIGMQEKRHKKEMRRMQEQLDELHARVNYHPANIQPPMPIEDSLNNSNDNELDRKLYSLVQKVRDQEKQEELKKQQYQNAQHVYKKQSELASTLDKHSEKYDDFDDVVKAKDAPYTESMQAVALLLHDIPGMDIPETLYRLGKDKNKLHEISKLHPLDQAKEVMKLAIATMNNGGSKSNNTASQPLGNIKNNPVTSSSVNSKTSVGEIRRRMKENGNKWG
ncbi:MAG TPA: hypothetical protein VNF93_02340 [Buchnera sp. (in: enterobacteria)]|nr:hypothetical protein [Buchnera sp. (in: enterobacteria)]